MAQGAIVPCGICQKIFEPVDIQYVEREHRLSKGDMPDDKLESDEWNDLKYFRYVHGQRDPRHDCHRAKTAKDRKVLAKSDRIRGLTKTRKGAKIRSGKMRGGRDDGLKRTMSGRVVDRKTGKPIGTR